MECNENSSRGGSGGGSSLRLIATGLPGVGRLGFPLRTLKSGDTGKCGSAEIRSVTSSGKARSDSKGTTATGAWSDSGGVVRLGDGVGGGLCLARLHLNGAIGELRYVNGLVVDKARVLRGMEVAEVARLLGAEF